MKNIDVKVGGKTRKSQLLLQNSNAIDIDIVEKKKLTSSHKINTGDAKPITKTAGRLPLTKKKKREDFLSTGFRLHPLSL